MLITSHLPNYDIKSLRLTARFFRDIAILRLNRVFLSPSKQDIDVFIAIAEHDVFRRQVDEIIWDDTTDIGVRRWRRGIHPDQEALVPESTPESVPDWFI